MLMNLSTTLLHGDFNRSEKCYYATYDPTIQSSGMFQYQKFVYCYFDPSLYWLGLVPLSFVLVFMLAALSIVADRYFCPNLFIIVNCLHLSHNIAGVTFLAFGNGAPDIFSSIASILGQGISSPGFAFGGLLGAGIFLSTVVVSIVTCIKPFEVMRRPFLRDLIFYLITLYWVFYMIYKKRIRLIDSIGLLVLYILYVFTVAIGRFIRINVLKEPVSLQVVNESIIEAANDTIVCDGVVNSSGQPKLSNFYSDTNKELADDVEDDELLLADDQTENSPLIFKPDRRRRSVIFNQLRAYFRPCTIKRWRTSNLRQKISLVLKVPLLFLFNLTIPIITYSNGKIKWRKIVIFIQCLVCPTFILCILQKFDYMIAGKIPLVIVVVCFGAFCALFVALFTKLDEPPEYYTAMAYVGFVIAILWIYALAREVVNLLTVFGSILNLSQEILGLTVLAWSNSLGDLVSDTAVAMKGYPRMAISACFGGPLFNILIGMGISFTILCAKESTVIEIVVTPVTELLCLTLAISLTSSLIVLTASGFKATRIYAMYLLLLYFVFMIAVVITESGLLPAVW